MLMEINDFLHRIPPDYCLDVQLGTDKSTQLSMRYFSDFGKFGFAKHAKTASGLVQKEPQKLVILPNFPNYNGRFAYFE